MCSWKQTVVAAALFIIAPSVALANGNDLLTQDQLHSKAKQVESLQARLARMQSYRAKYKSMNPSLAHNGDPKTAGLGVPELDPGAATSSVVLLLGGAIVLTSRRRVVVAV
jgi:hypothetical protein